MTVKELRSLLDAYPDDMPVVIPDDWGNWPYTLLQPIGRVAAVTMNDVDGGTFDWGHKIDPDCGMLVFGLVLHPEE